MFPGKAPMSPEATAPVRKFRLLTDTLIHAMRSGAMKPGDRLPSVRALCRIHQLSTSTVRRVLEDLEAAGLIEAQPRRGYFVLEPRMPSPSPSVFGSRGSVPSSYSRPLESPSPSASPSHSFTSASSFAESAVR